MTTEMLEPQHIHVLDRPPSDIMSASVDAQDMQPHLQWTMNPASKSARQPPLHP